MLYINNISEYIYIVTDRQFVFYCVFKKIKANISDNYG